MLKKTLFVPCLLCLGLMLCLAACGTRQPQNKAASSNNKSTTIKTEQSLSAASPSGKTRSKTQSPEQAPIPRADPGYLQWLEKQAMLNSAHELARMVSGSELPWGSNTGGPNTLLEAADIWLHVHPRSLLSSASRPVLKELADPAALNALAGAGIKGLFVAPTSESGALWREKSGINENNEDDDAPVALAFAGHMGTDKDFAQLVTQSEQRGIQLGGDLLFPASGTGPDFFLATRAVREYPGIYMMVEIPRANWELLPAAQENQHLVLGAEHIEGLVKERLLPPALTREALTWVQPGGWAATGEVRGQDGLVRRWVFRWHETPARPLLNWDDPSGAAQRIFSGSVIRQVGVLRQALAGLRLEPLLGLETAYGPDQASLEPAPSALRALARETRRYGGWSFQRETLPVELTERLFDSGTDFIKDNLTSPAAEYALLTGDSQPLRKLLSAFRHLDQRRFVRGTPGPEGLSLLPFAHSAFAADARQRFLQLADFPVENNVLYTTGPALAARAAAQGGESLDAHLLLISLRAALPGLLFISGTDLAGALPVSAGKAAHGVLGGWALTASAASQGATRQGSMRAQCLYPPVATQLKQANSMVGHLARLSAIRAQTRLAQGSLVDAFEAGAASALSVLTRLPDGKHLLAVANFSAQSIQSHTKMPVMLAGAQALDLLEQKEVYLKDTELALELGPWACRLLLLSHGAAKQGE